MQSFNQDWKFRLGELTSGHLMEMDESEFRSISIPHDFSIEQPYNKDIGDGCTGYLVGGIGWYRKTFEQTKEMTGKKVFLYFDGIYNRSNIYINEQFLKFHPYGYSPTCLDITDYLKENRNVIAVKVDRTRYADSRWYTGSGIYRKVKLLILPKTYIPIFGVKVLTYDNKKVEINVDIKREENIEAISLKTEIYAPDGKKVFETTSSLGTEQEQQIKISTELANPILWEIYKGNQYIVRNTLISGSEETQLREDKFGIREFRFDVNRGFFLNGKQELIKGVCLHHDAGLVGAAVPKDVLRRRFERLIEAGCNAIRTAHNPMSREFIELCDELGLLVQEEFYDEWDNPKDKRMNMNETMLDYITRGHHEFFKDYAKEDLQIIVERDFNSPSIIQWSIGNEIEWTYPKYVEATGYFGAHANGNYFWQLPPFSVEEIRERVKHLPKEQYEVGETARKLATWTKEIDTSRPVIANCILPSASYESGMIDALDMVGFSYRQVVYEHAHIHYPEKAIMGTENLGQWHEWKQVLEKEYIPGIFLWTGIDYMGESSQSRPSDDWPRKATRSGLLDCAGFPKGSYHFFKTLWNASPSIHMVSQTLEKSPYCWKEGKLLDKKGCEWNQRLWIWQEVNEHWNYKDGEALVIEVYSNAESVTLYLNDKEISTSYLKDFEDRIYKWYLPFVSGTLRAVGSHGEAVSLETTKGATSCKLTADKTKLQASLDEVAHIEVDLIDEDGKQVRYQEAEVEFEIQGDVRYYGVDNGSDLFVGDHSAKKIITNKGKALLIIGKNTDSEIKIRAIINGKLSNTIIL